MTAKKKAKKKVGRPDQGLTARTTVQLTKDELTNLRDEALKQGRSVPGQIRFMMYGAS